MRPAFASLTSRLVVTTVALVVVVSALIAVAATLAMDSRLTDQVDEVWVGMVPAFGAGDDAKPFASISQGDVDLGLGSANQP